MEEQALPQPQAATDAAPTSDSPHHRRNMMLMMIVCGIIIVIILALVGYALGMQSASSSSGSSSSTTISAIDSSSSVSITSAESSSSLSSVSSSSVSAISSTSSSSLATHECGEINLSYDPTKYQIGFSGATGITDANFESNPDTLVYRDGICTTEQLVFYVAQVGARLPCWQCDGFYAGQYVAVTRTTLTEYNSDLSVDAAYNSDGVRTVTVTNSVSPTGVSAKLSESRIKNEIVNALGAATVFTKSGKYYSLGVHQSVANPDAPTTAEQSAYATRKLTLMEIAGGITLD